MTANSVTEPCAVCGAQRSPGAESATVQSNVRRFQRERFAVWRCESCESIHADGAADLDPYYAAYPMHAVRLDWRARAVYRSQLRRLVRAGFRREHSMLDYGCGSGAFVRFLHRAGYTHCVGYDAYNPEHSEPALIARRQYECVLAQDVLEHVPDPWRLLTALRELLAPGGLLAIGTPNASAIDLRDPASYVHTLHQPYHRHIVSKTALLKLGRRLGLSLLRYYPRSYINTPIPFINHPFLLYYLRCQDDSFDAAFAPVQPSLRLLSPRGIFLGLFGAHLAPETDVMALYRAEG